ncbi:MULTISPECIES: CorA family divalent cation transporter [unclassified Butyrivibrio]|uniref:magnesium transporter CorA family protein n=1 Tax=unclassified Butyrivibrio TaxID=2639466 RepID=UPI000400B73E|nr:MULTISPECIES: CorA family divalent cation transporter [unclassified Butyrivibrio]SDB65148.1 magnesium transporter [Butyrivibrio sp. INlla16]SEM16176.1 magnesium transporter [Butyrivibrio sp. ob235]
MFYLIKEMLEEVTAEEIKNAKDQYVAILTFEEWRNCSGIFDMGIDMDIEDKDILTTKAEVNYDSLTGSFVIPDRTNMSGESSRFAFALDEKGIVFIDDSGAAAKLIKRIKNTKKWRMPSLERFLYDFLDQIVKDDLRLMERYDKELDAMENAILNEDEKIASGRVNEIRSNIRDLRIHYEQLMDLGQEFEENENSFFKQENIRYFRLFLNRMDRLHDTSTAIRDYTMQIRDLYKAHLDIKQNRIMTVLTVVTTIFLPLTLIVGWYGMNFRYMPELEWRWGYPVVIAISILIVLVSLLFFRKKKWL